MSFVYFEVIEVKRYMKNIKGKPTGEEAIEYEIKKPVIVKIK